MDVVIEPDYGEFILHGVKYDETCSIRQQPMPNAATKLMVKAVVQTLLEIFGHGFKQVNITDNSFFDCASVRSRVPMANHNVLLYGKTWYQRHFHAKCEDRVKATYISEYEARLSKPVTMTFDDFCRRFGGVRDRLKPCWQASQTWMELFQRINRIYGCDYFQSIQELDLYFGIIDLKGSEWSIPIKNVQRWKLNNTVTILRPFKKLKKTTHGGYMGTFGPDKPMLL